MHAVVRLFAGFDPLIDPRYDTISFQAKQTQIRDVEIHDGNADVT
jgi:hypothetical protein